MYKNKKIVVVIPARGGSKGVPGKNIKEINRKPLISYNIEAAKEAKYVDEVYVSTDSDKIFDVSKDFGAEVIRRPDELATDEASSESALIHFAEEVDFDILVFMQCTSPLTLSDDVDGAIEEYFRDGVDSVLSVCDSHGGFLCGGFTWQEGGKLIGYDYMKRPRRQEMKKEYRENGAIYVMSKEGLLKHRNRLYGNIGFYVMPYSRSFEIDEVEDFELLEKIFPVLKKEMRLERVVKKIKMVVFDVDGVFTDGSVYLSEDNKEMLKFSRVDGKGIQLLRENGFDLAVISLEDSDIVRNRMKKLGINEVHLGVKNKLQIFNDIKDRYQLVDEEICFCGDDIQDIKVLKKVKLSCCPNNSLDIVKDICFYKSQYKGGKGFVRDVANILIKGKKNN